MALLRTLLFLWGLSELTYRSYSFSRGIYSPFRPHVGTSGLKLHAQMDSFSNILNEFDTARLMLERALAASPDQLPGFPPVDPNAIDSRRSPRHHHAEAELIALLAGPSSSSAYLGLWSLWASEAGIEAQKRLESSASLIVGPNVASDQIDRAEAEFISLATDYPNWAEPLNRLSLIHFHRENYEMSLKLALEVHKLKPWHFGALNTVAHSFQRLGLVEKAEEWSVWLLPPDTVFVDVNGNRIEPRRWWVNVMMKEYRLRHARRPRMLHGSLEE